MASALFPDQTAALAKIRRDSLMLAAQNHFAGVDIDDEYIWSKLMAAESEAQRILRVKFQPTAFFPNIPTQDEIDALNGMPWEEDPAYDYDPLMFQDERWGFIVTRNRPLISVKSLKYAYPSASTYAFEVPLDWLKIDKKYGQVRVVPTTIAAATLVGSFMMNLIAGGRSVPQIMNLVYVAGLTDVTTNYPELVDVVKKMAVLKLIEDGFLAQSGSISADGLSQSMSVDMDKYHDSIDRILNGGTGSNGGLMAAIHGIRLGVM